MLGFASILLGSAICNREMQYLEADARCYLTGVDGIDWDAFIVGMFLPGRNWQAFQGTAF